ncbi:MAG: chemotaxis protein CheW [Actinomycetota bacterium]|nr:chemotaxis protein CheW [Actinomycetota bacterium]
MKRLATFTVDGRFLGVDVTRVREVLRPQELTRVPLAPPQIAGLINLRGEIVTAFDLGVALGRRRRGHEERPMNVVVTTEHGPVSMLVDAVSDVLDLEEDAFERPPSTLRGAARDLILGAYKLDGRLLLELDLDEAIRTTSPSGIDAEVDDR